MSSIKHKYIEIATRKIISSYGGVGSLFETTKGSVKIEPFDQWEYVHFGIEKFVEEQDLDNLARYTIEDNRLLSRLKYQFGNLDRLVRVPDNESGSNFITEPKDKTNIIRATYFPKWFYCNRCGRLKHINDWYNDWQRALPNISKDDVASSFQEPKCAHCYLKFKNESYKPSSKLHFNPTLCLEQVRFIMTAPNGAIRDLPWELWNTAIKGNKNEDGGKVSLDFDNKCCDDQDLRYIKSDIFEDYTGIRIKCYNCKKESTLSGLFGLKLRTYAGENVFYKPVIKSSNSVYYPIIFNSIYIPVLEETDVVPSGIKVTIETLYANNKTPEEISSLLSLELDKVNRVLGLDTELVLETENEYRQKEYDFILSGEEVNNENYISHKSDIQSLSELNIKSIVQIKRLKMTSVQTGYTRQEPYDRDLFLKDGSTAKVQYTSKWGTNAKFLPAIESFGEGLFIELDDEVIDRWYDTNRASVDARVERLQENARNSNFFNDQEELSNKEFAKLLLIHTLSHVLIKELEFLCGYPATSICERLYVGERMQGVLIYTIAGAEGSYGGLVSQGTEERFNALLQSAIFRACDCASDPVCYNSEPQGIGGQNLASCYSCTLLPENSCERFNSRIDRAVLIDKEYGFFTTNIK